MKMRITGPLRHGNFTRQVLENFQVSDQKVPDKFLRHYILVKQIYAKVNKNENKLDTKRAQLIDKACATLLKMDKKSFRDHFPIDVVQSGGGTSTNMMVNEVIAGLAKESVHSNDHVNMSQSSNDTFPGVIMLTSYFQLEELLKELALVEKTFLDKSREFNKVKKVGRTHLQDALPITLGDEFSAFSSTLKKDRVFLEDLKKLLLVLPFGATALGSQQNITVKLRKNLIKAIAKKYQVKFKTPANYFEATSSSGDFEKLAAGLASLAADLIKICNDLRLLASGPRAGLAEINLPSAQAGSSIMPGKVNPSILEGLNMTCFRVLGLHTTVTTATLNAQLQLQAFMPVIGFSLYEAFELLTNGLSMFRTKCLTGITPNHKQIKRHLEESFVYATEYSEKLGYARVAELVKKSYRENLNLRDLLETEVKKINRL